jgi:hypothetical protein
MSDTAFLPFSAKAEFPAPGPRWRSSGASAAPVVRCACGTQLRALDDGQLWCPCCNTLAGEANGGER